MRTPVVGISPNFFLINDQYPAQAAGNMNIQAIAEVVGAVGLADGLTLGLALGLARGIALGDALGYALGLTLGARVGPACVLNAKSTSASAVQVLASAE